MNIYKITFLLFSLVVSFSCKNTTRENTTDDTAIAKTENDKKQAQTEKKMPPELTYIDGFPDEIIGCSCYFSRNKEDLKNEKHLYLDTYYKGTAFIKVDDELIRIDLEDQSKSNYQVDILFDEEEEEDKNDRSPREEVYSKTGKIIVTLPKGQILVEKFVGVCGC